MNKNGQQQDAKYNAELLTKWTKVSRMTFEVAKTGLSRPNLWVHTIRILPIQRNMRKFFRNSSPEQLILTVSSCAQLNTFCKIWGPYRSVVTDWSLVACNTVSTWQWFLMFQRASLQGHNVDVKEGEVAICLSLECSGYSRDFLVVHSEERERQSSFLP